MTVTIPPEVLKSSLSLSAKLIVGAVLSHPAKKKKQIATALGVGRNQIFEALKQAREKGIDIDNKRTDIDTFSTDIRAKSTENRALPNAAPGERTENRAKRTDIDTPHPIDSKIEEKQTENNQGNLSPGGNPPSKIPTLEEVTAYATRYNRVDLAMPFFDSNQERNWMTSTGAPIRSWQALFRWQVNNKPKVATNWNRSTKPLEEHLLEIDGNY